MDLSDALIGVGVAFIGVGLWLVYPPASLIVVGVLLLVGGLRMARLRVVGSDRSG